MAGINRLTALMYQDLNEEGQPELITLYGKLLNKLNTNLHPELNLKPEQVIPFLSR